MSIKEIATLSLGYEQVSNECKNHSSINETTVLLNCKIVEKESSDWRDSYIDYFVSPQNNQKIACAIITGHNMLGDFESPNFHWYFPGKTKWVILGMKRSYELLRQHGGTIPQWLEDAVKGYPTKGDGWAVIN